MTRWLMLLLILIMSLISAPTIASQQYYKTCVVIQDAAYFIKTSLDTNGFKITHYDELYQRYLSHHDVALREQPFAILLRAINHDDHKTTNAYHLAFNAFVICMRQYDLDMMDYIIDGTPV